jgi:hypothetical protein
MQVKIRLRFFLVSKEKVTIGLKDYQKVVVASFTLVKKTRSEAENYSEFPHSCWIILKHLLKDIYSGKPINRLTK